MPRSLGNFSSSWEHIYNLIMTSSWKVMEKDNHSSAGFSLYNNQLLLSNPRQHFPWDGKWGPLWQHKSWVKSWITWTHDRFLPITCPEAEWSCLLWREKVGSLPQLGAGSQGLTAPQWSCRKHLGVWGLQISSVCLFPLPSGVNIPEPLFRGEDSCQRKCPLEPGDKFIPSWWLLCVPQEKIENNSEDFPCRRQKQLPWLLSSICISLRKLVHAHSGFVHALLSSPKVYFLFIAGLLQARTNIHYYHSHWNCPK